jgi:flagellar basal body-associated protein FliL
MKNILKLLPKIGLGIVFAIMAIISIATAYIVFAPDTWPKPFYLMYDSANASAATEGGANGTEAVKGTPTAIPISAQLEMKPGQGIMLDTGSKIVNLVDPGSRKYLRVGIVLEFAPSDLKYFTMTAEEKKAFVTAFNDDINARLPVINDVIITLLSNQTFDAVYTAEGKETLRKNIMKTINTQLPEYHVIFVYFTEFVVQ